MAENVISCDECGGFFDTEQIEFKQTVTSVDDKKFEIIYFICPDCGKSYIVAMLDYWGKKLQNKYIKAMDNYRAAYKAGCNPGKLQQKLMKVEALKNDAMSYQNELLHMYRDLIPEGILK